MGAAVDADAATVALFAPLPAVVFRCVADGSHLELLDAVEGAETAPMAPRRAAEFAAGRICAHRGLAVLGRDGAPITRGGRGEPVWPATVSGSISHTRGLCLAVVVDRAEALVGIDVEEVARVQPAIARRVLTEAEQHALTGRSSAEAQQRLATVFAAKEAFYKAHFQLDPRYLGFDVIEVEVHEDGRLDLAPGVPGAVAADVLASTTARFRLEHGRVIVAVWIPSAP